MKLYTSITKEVSNLHYFAHEAVDFVFEELLCPLQSLRKFLRGIRWDYYYQYHPIAPTHPAFDDWNKKGITNIPYETRDKILKSIKISAFEKTMHKLVGYERWWDE